MGTFKDLTGKRFGYLKVLRYFGYNEKGHTSLWECQCECGNICTIRGEYLKNGHTKSCGCKKGLIKHNKAKTRIYNIYYNMLQRCNNPKNKAYNNYGERGITICKEWQDNFINFYNWAITNGYTETLTIDRIDVNGNYEPDNCRWATHFEQQNNMRRNRKFIYNSKEYTGGQIAKFLNITSHLFYCKLRNHSLDEIIEQYVSLQ